MSQRIIDRSYVGEVLQHIYESDLNIKITLFSEGGYFYSLQEDKRIPLQGTTVEEPPTQLPTVGNPNAGVGGGFNSTMSVNLASPLGPGKSINVQFRLGVVQSGNFRFLIIIEALP